MSKSIQQKMHKQHEKWKRDHNAWLADIDLWKKETQIAFTNLSEIEDALRDSLESIVVHADKIWENEQRTKAHELAISGETKDHKNKTDKEWATAHSAHAAQHEQAAKAHKRIKKHHHTVIAEVVKLLKKVRKAL